MLKHHIRCLDPTGYHGVDPGTGKHILMAPGELTTVSAKKASQLIADFPTKFEDLGPMPDAAGPVPVRNIVQHTKPVRPQRTKRQGS